MKLEALRASKRMAVGETFECNDKAQVDYLVKHKLAKVISDKPSPLAIEGKNPNEPHTQEAPKPEAMKTSNTLVDPEEAKPVKPVAPKPAESKPQA